MKDKKKPNWKEDWDQEYVEEYAATTGEDPEWAEKLDQPGVMFVVFLGMILVSAVLCAIFWAITHQREDTVVLPTNESSVVDYINTTGTLEDSQVSQDSEESDEPEEDLNLVITSDGREVLFTDCDDTITPKEYVNLRIEPSTSGGESTVYTQANAGEKLHRTGISQEAGWSRLEYGDQILYVVTSNVEEVEE